MKHYIVIVLFAFCITEFALSQNLEKIGKKDMLRINGGLNYNSIFYNASGIASRRDPHTWFFNGNVTLSILDVSLPFNYSYSNQEGQFTQPFNMTSCTPTYKWIKGYAGYTSLSFSNYTLAGHVFLGGGVELTPKKWKIAAMYGRLKKASSYDAFNESDANMSYKRMGYGAKVGYENNLFGFNLIYFAAKDDASSIPFIPAVTQTTPQSNIVMSAAGKVKLNTQWNIQGEYAISGLNKNILSPSDLTEGSSKNILGLGNGAQFFSAYKSSVNYTHKLFNVGFNFEHIDPDYKTLGAYYFNNDLENYTISTGWHILKNKLNISTNTGLQKNNLDKMKLGSTKRIVGSINLSYSPNVKWNFTTAYSNFTTYTNIRPSTDPYYISSAADTLNYYQLTQNANASANYNFGNTKARQGIMLAANFQTTGEKTGSIQNTPSNLINGNLAYSLSWTPTKTTASLSFNYNQSELQNTSNKYFGPNLSISQSLNKNKMRMTLGSGYNQAINNGIANSKIINSRLSLSYNPKMKNEKIGKPTISFNCIYVNKLSTQEQTTPFNELTATLNLGYSF